MATAVAQSGALPAKPRIPGRRYDHVFFSAMTLAMVVTVFVGFAKTYYLAGVLRAPLPARIIHIHGALFSCWLLMLIAQTSLVSVGRVKIHRQLGMAGFALACVMIAVGLLAATNALVRGTAPGGLDALTFYIVPVSDMVIFGTLIAFAYRARKDSAAHKRLIIIATSDLTVAALARWPIAFLYHKPLPATFLAYIFIVALVAYDLWSTHKVHRATIWASVFLIVMQQIRVPLGMTSAWHSFATWVISIAR